jgi:cytochrome c
MRVASWTLAALVAGAALGGLTASSATSPAAAQSADVDADAEAAKVAQEELEKAIARGKELFEGRTLGRKSCQECHEDPDKPEDDLSETEWSYPSYSRRARRVVTLQQKINEMIKFKARGKELDANGADIAAIAAYVTSLRKR